MRPYNSLVHVELATPQAGMAVRGKHRLLQAELAAASGLAATGGRKQSVASPGSRSSRP